MKKIGFIFLIGSILFVSCKKFLDLPNDGRVTLEDIFQDNHMSAGYLTTCYSYMPTFYSNSDFGISYGGSFLAAYSDEAEDVYDAITSNVRDWYTGNVSANNFPLANNAWANYFAGIRACNIFLERISTATSPFSEKQREEWLAQAFTLRAFYYLQLIKRYGGVPLITTELPEDFDVVLSKRESFGNCVRQIFKDCDEALARPIDVFGFSTKGENYGKMTPAIAHAIKSQAALYATSPLWFDGSVSYEEAAKITKEALDYCLSPAADFKLFTMSSVTGFYSNAYEFYFLLQPDFERTRDKETILNSFKAPENQLKVWQLSGLPINMGVDRAGASPSQNLVDSYEMKNGITPFLLDDYGVIRKDANGNPIINPDPNNIYDPQHPYDGRDDRFYASIYFNGAAKVLGEKISTQIGGNCEISSSELKHTRTGYYLRKFNDGRSDVNNNLDGWMRIFRLGELYLNFAEAANRFTHNPQMAISSTIPGSIPMSAVDALNAIRNRAGLPNLIGNATTDHIEFEKRCANERRVELAFEQHRFFDVRRWRILDQTDREIYGVHISRQSNGEEKELYPNGTSVAMPMTPQGGTPYYGTIMQAFISSEPFEGISVNCTSYGYADAKVTLSLYKWDPVSKTPTGPALATKDYKNYADDSDLTVYRSGGGTFSAGVYAWVLNNASGHVGVYYVDEALPDVLSIRNSEELPYAGFKGTCVIKSSIYDYNRFVVSQRNSWQPKYLKFPIPQDQTNKMVKTGSSDWQNEGW